MFTDIGNKQKLSYLEFYQNDISPKLKEIDLLLKTSAEILDEDRITELLDLTFDELKHIMSSENLDTLNRTNFYKIMYNGSSEICKLFRRELDCGSPYIYTRRDISYIYNLDLSKVNEVCDNLRIVEATAYTLPEIFAEIQI